MTTLVQGAHQAEAGDPRPRDTRVPDALWGRVFSLHMSPASRGQMLRQTEAGAIQRGQLPRRDG